jgi:Arc/MetJ family transcription regulator
MRTAARSHLTFKCRMVTLRHMRTTIRLDDALLRQAKAAAAASGRSLNDLIEDAVRSALAARPAATRVSEPDLPTYRGRGLQAGVDLDDSAALLDRMERSARE